MTKKTKVFKIFKNILYYGIITYLSFLIIFSIILPGKTIKYMGIGWYNVVTNSMEPEIMVGDYIFAHALINKDNLSDGDVIIFETFFYNNGVYSKNIVTHHFSHFSEEGYVITYPHSEYNKAVVDRIYDEWNDSAEHTHYVQKGDILGKVMFKLPFGKRN